MKALLVNENGSLDNLKIENVPIPKIASNQILVKVKACRY